MTLNLKIRERNEDGGFGELVEAFPDRIVPLSPSEQMFLEVMTGMQAQLEMQSIQIAEQQRIIEEQQAAIEDLKNNTTTEGAK